MTKKKCRWIPQGDDPWATSCGKDFTPSEGGTLLENNFKFCPFCGKKIEDACED